MLHSLFDTLIDSSVDTPTAAGHSHDVTNNFLVPDFVCAIIASEKSTQFGLLRFLKDVLQINDDYLITVLQ